MWKLSLVLILSLRPQIIHQYTLQQIEILEQRLQREGGEKLKLRILDLKKQMEREKQREEEKKQREQQREEEKKQRKQKEEERRRKRIERLQREKERLEAILELRREELERLLEEYKEAEKLYHLGLNDVRFQIIRRKINLQRERVEYVSAKIKEIEQELKEESSGER